MRFFRFRMKLIFLKCNNPIKLGRLRLFMTMFVQITRYSIKFSSNWVSEQQTSMSIHNPYPLILCDLYNINKREPGIIFMV